LAREFRENGPEEEHAPSGEEGGGGRRRFVRPPRLCQFCAEKATHIDYKQIDLLKRFVTEQGRIRSRRQTGNCARHQRILARAVKRARHIALLPFTASRMR
jgi:small subunit ribosomal protein S18